MRVLHTSDLHIGKKLYSQDRSSEFKSFFNWLKNTIVEKQADMLLIAGDVFDVSNPPNEAAKMYYDFLLSLSGTCCRNVVVTSGNHDSRDYLNAPADLMKLLNIHVVSSVCKDSSNGEIVSDDEIIPISDADGNLQALVCAVPFLKETDMNIRQGISGDECCREYIRCVAGHYNAVSSKADEMRNGMDIPLIGMGHLFAAGSSAESPRDIRIQGNAVGINPSYFAGLFDYLALGHIHKPMEVCSSYIRYSGSPLNLDFGELSKDTLEDRSGKSVCLIDFDGRVPSVETVEVPLFRRMTAIREHSLSELSGRLSDIQRQEYGMDEADRRYIEITFTGTPAEFSSANASLDDFKDLLILRMTSVPDLPEQVPEYMRQYDEAVSFDLLEKPEEVFSQLLDIKGFSEEDKSELMRVYREVIDICEGEN